MTHDLVIVQQAVEQLVAGLLSWLVAAAAKAGYRWLIAAAQRPAVPRGRPEGTCRPRSGSPPRRLSAVTRPGAVPRVRTPRRPIPPTRPRPCPVGDYGGARRVRGENLRAE